MQSSITSGIDETILKIWRISNDILNNFIQSYLYLFLNDKGGIVTVIGQDGKPSQIPASSLNMATTPNLPFETFTSNLGAAGKRSLHEI